MTIPRPLVVERVKLDVVERGSAVHNGEVAIEECQHLVAFLNISLVGSDGNNLVPSQLLFTDPCLQVARVSRRIGPSKDNAVSVGVRPSVLSHLLNLS